MEKNGVFHWKQDQQTLMKMLKKGNQQARGITRAWIMIKSNENLSNKEIMQQLKIGHEMLNKIRTRYGEEGLEAAIKDKPRPGAPKKVDPLLEARITAIACQDPPRGRSQWTTALINKEISKVSPISISLGTVKRILHQHNLKPWKKR